MVTKTDVSGKFKTLMEVTGRDAEGLTGMPPDIRFIGSRDTAMGGIIVRLEPGKKPDAKKLLAPKIADELERIVCMVPGKANVSDLKTGVCAKKMLVLPDRISLREYGLPTDGEYFAGMVRSLVGLAQRLEETA